MPNPLWPIRRQGPNRWLRWGASFVCLAQALVIIVVVLKACLETEGGCHWYSFLRTAFSGHKFRSLPVEKASSEIIVLPPVKDFDESAFYEWRKMEVPTGPPIVKDVTSGDWCAGRNARKSNSGCVCEPGWSGSSCSIPRRLLGKNHPKMSVATRPRNVICAFGIRYDELELAELRIRSLSPLVDLFVVTRAFVTAPTVSGTTNDALYEKFVSGWLADLQDKILYVSPFENVAHHRPGSSVDISNAAVVRRLSHAISTRVSDFHRDDVIIITRPEELPSPETIATIKYHTGFKEDVIGAVYARTVFNLAAALGPVSTSPLAVTFETFWKRFNYSFPLGIDENSSILGTPATPGGWSCKWCLSKAALINRVKLFTEMSVMSSGGEKLAALELHEMVAAREKVRKILPSTFLPDYAKYYRAKYGFLLGFQGGRDGPFLWTDPHPI